VVLTIRQSVALRRPAEAVFDYVSDFNRASEWRTEVRESAMSPPGPMTEGSELHEVAVIMGRPVVTVSVVGELEPGRRFTFDHVSGPIPVSGEYLVEPDGEGATLHYTLDADLRGPWRIVAPYLRRSGPKTMAASLERLRARVDGAEAP
jgi:hypothetical protein